MYEYEYYGHTASLLAPEAQSGNNWAKIARFREKSSMFMFEAIRSKYIMGHEAARIDVTFLDSRRRKSSRGGRAGGSATATQQRVKWSSL